MGRGLHSITRDPNRQVTSRVLSIVSTLALLGGSVVWATQAHAVGPVQLDLRVLLIGGPAGDPTTGAWQAALAGEGVASTVATATGSYGSYTVSLPPLVDPGNVNHGLFNGIVVADSPSAFAAGQLSAVDTYESTYGVRQLDGYTYPNPALGLTDVSAGSMDGTTATLTPAGLAAFAALKGSLPFSVGSYGYGATAGANFTPFLTNGSGQVLGGVYQHPVSSTDPQSGVAELELTFDYNASQVHWLVLAPELINWVTRNLHLGLFRNYLGQDVDDVLIADNEWSSQYQCTPGATDPSDFTCPAGVANNPADTPPDVQMSAADATYVANWEAQTGIKLDLVFNGVGACTAPSVAAESSANCTGSLTEHGTTYTDPGQLIDASAPNDQGLVNGLLSNQGAFNWINHTWSHLFLGCLVWAPQPAVGSTPSSGGSLSPGTYTYEVTAATAYGESEPSSPMTVSVSGGAATILWPEAINGTGANGTPGPTLAQLEARYSGGTGFWGYDVYREAPGAATFALAGQVAENPSATTATTYSFTDTGAATGGPPSTSATFPTATNPGIDCSNAPGSWMPAGGASTDTTIDQEIGLNQAFAAANHLSNYSQASVVTGEHSGLENPNMPTAFADTGITAFAADASRQVPQYTLSSGGNVASSAPRYPSNIYYNASNWSDELNEYNTIYVAQGTSIGDPTYPNETGHCVGTPSTTCLTTPATESSLLASETGIELSHVLANNPRVGYAHQSDLIGPAGSGYTLLTFLDSVLSSYNSLYNATAPVAPTTDTIEAQVLSEQSAWAAAESSGAVTASETNGSVTLTNASATPISVPLTAPAGSTLGGAPFGEAYGGTRSAWVPLGSTPAVISTPVPPAITSASSVTATAGSPFSFTVVASGSPAPALTETGSLPAGLSFTDNGNGTATLAGTPATASAGTYPLSFTATNSAGAASQAFTLTVSQGPVITSAASATADVGQPFTFAVMASGSPAPALTQAGALPAGLTFTDNGNGTATIAGTPAPGTAKAYALTLTATNAAGSATQAFTLSVDQAPAFTSAASVTATVGKAFTFSVTTSGAPPASVTESGALPSGVSFINNGNGSATLSGTPSPGTGKSYPLTLTASNAGGTTTQAFVLTVDQAPAFTSPNRATATLGRPFTFTVTTTGFPPPALTESGALPAGLTFTDNHNGTATLSGTPTSLGGLLGINYLTFRATNAAGSASQAFVLVVRL